MLNVNEKGLSNMKMLRFYCGLTSPEMGAVDPARYRAVMDRWFEGYTSISACGRWAGQDENTLILEVCLTDADYATKPVRLIAECLRQAGKQDAVMSVTHCVDCEFHNVGAQNHFHEGEFEEIAWMRERGLL